MNNTTYQVHRNQQTIQIYQPQELNKTQQQQPAQFQQGQQNQNNQLIHNHNPHPSLNLDYFKLKIQNQEIIENLQSRNPNTNPQPTANTYPHPRLLFPKESGVIIFHQNDKIKLVPKKDEERARSRSKEKIANKQNSQPQYQNSNFQAQKYEIPPWKLSEEERTNLMMKILNEFQQAEKRRRQYAQLLQ